MAPYGARFRKAALSLCWQRAYAKNAKHTARQKGKHEVRRQLKEIT